MRSERADNYASSQTRRTRRLPCAELLRLGIEAGHISVMTARKPLPPDFAHRPFASRAAVSAGVPVSRLAAADLERPFHGVRQPREADQVASTLLHCRALAAVIRGDQFFSHETAAEMWGCPLPPSRSAQNPIHLTTAFPRQASRIDGVVGHRSNRSEFTHRHGLRVTTPEDTFLDVSARLSVPDLVAVGDHLILEPRVLDPNDLRPYTTVEKLALRGETFHGRGAVAAASAIRQLRQGAASRPETLLRLLLVDAGFDEPLTQQPIRDAAGKLVGYVDLLFPLERVAVEYDGEHHRTDSVQYNHDVIRKEELRQVLDGFVSVRKWELFGNRASAVRRVRRALDHARPGASR